MSCSKERKFRREATRTMAKAMKKLETLLDEMCAFLDQQPKPSDDEVREKFIHQEERWKRYCTVNKLTDTTALMYNKEFGQIWKTVYAKPTDESAI